MTIFFSRRNKLQKHSLPFYKFCKIQSIRLGPYEDKLWDLAVCFLPFSSNNGTGGWSTYGCELSGYNRTHINCSCSHLTNIAVIMDNAPYMVSHHQLVDLTELILQSLMVEEQNYESAEINID